MDAVKFINVFQRSLLSACLERGNGVLIALISKTRSCISVVGLKIKLGPDNVHVVSIQGATTDGGEKTVLSLSTPHAVLAQFKFTRLRVLIGAEFMAQ